VDQVRYFDGATYVINENASTNDGITLGGYINMNDKDGMPKNGDGEFDPTQDYLYMHEYGHYLQSQEYGPGYLISVAIPSIISYKNRERIDESPNGLTTHKVKWYERGANKKASKYFRKKYGITWNESAYPIDMPDYLSNTNSFLQLLKIYKK
jgi:hypothetical protein